MRHRKPKKPAPTVTVETETSPTPPITNKRDRKGDPLWDVRRRRLDIALTLSFGTIFASMAIGDEMAAAIAPPAFITIGGVIAAYFGVSEWGRINGVLGTTVTTETSVSTQPPNRE
jgi:hypothetical protein